MRTPSTHSPSPARRVAAAALACGLVVGLASCSKDDAPDTAASGSATSGAGVEGGGKDGDKKAGGSAAPGQTGADGSTVSEAPASAAGRPAGAPTLPIEQLLLGPGDAPAYQLVVTPSSQIAEQVKAMSGIAQGATVTPPQCADLTSGALSAQQAPDTTAIATGQGGGSPVAIAVTTVTGDLAKQADLVSRCPEVDIVFPTQGGELKNHLKRSNLSDAPAPAGVEHYSAILQQSTASAAGQTMNSSVISLNGVVRGIGVNAVVQNPSGDVTPEAKKAAVDLFAKQVEKITRS